jgi:NifU-like protein involved in Fe-S cluster formation
LLDEKVIQYYRKITREGYQYYGKIEKPSIFLDSAGEKIALCSKSVDSYVHIFINIRDGIIAEVKYLCTCRPTTNVAAEIFCFLIKNRSINEAEILTEKLFSEALGTDDAEFLKAARGFIELLHRGLKRYREDVAAKEF